MYQHTLLCQWNSPCLTHSDDSIFCLVRCPGLPFRKLFSIRTCRVIDCIVWLVGNTLRIFFRQILFETNTIEIFNFAKNAVFDMHIKESMCHRKIYRPSKYARAFHFCFMKWYSVDRLQYCLFCRWLVIFADTCFNTILVTISSDSASYSVRSHCMGK